jgi:hypothetical protein
MIVFEVTSLICIRTGPEALIPTRSASAIVTYEYSGENQRRSSTAFIVHSIMLII